MDRLSNDNNYKQLCGVAWSHLISARMALSEGASSEARTQCRAALAIIKPQNKNTPAIAKALLGRAYAVGGALPQGKRLCEEAVNIAEQTGDLRLLADTRLLLAETLLESGEAKSALTTAMQAQEGCSRLRKQESEWRAWLIAARASGRLGNQACMQEQLLHANYLYTDLQVKWNADAFHSYTSRPDIQLLRSQFDQPTAR